MTLPKAEDILKESIGPIRYEASGSVSKTQLIHAMKEYTRQVLDSLGVEIYIPIEVSKERPENGHYFTIHPNIHSGIIEGAAEYHDGDFYLPEDGGYPSEDKKTTHWLKKQSILKIKDEL